MTSVLFLHVQVFISLLVFIIILCGTSLKISKLFFGVSDCYCLLFLVCFVVVVFFFFAFFFILYYLIVYVE